MLLDSNILIYAAQPRHGRLRSFIAEHSPAVSTISKIEVLGYHQLSDSDRTLLEALFSAAEILPMSDIVVEEAILLRQKRKMSLGDSIIAGTALVHGHRLLTHNTVDFSWIPGLDLLDPLENLS